MVESYGRTGGRISPSVFLNDREFLWNLIVQKMHKFIQILTYSAIRLLEEKDIIGNWVVNL